MPFPEFCCNWCKSLHLSRLFHVLSSPNITNFAITIDPHPSFKSLVTSHSFYLFCGAFSLHLLKLSLRILITRFNIHDRQILEFQAWTSDYDLRAELVCLPASFYPSSYAEFTVQLVYPLRDTSQPPRISVVHSLNVLHDNLHLRFRHVGKQLPKISLRTNSTAETNWLLSSHSDASYRLRRL